MKVSAGFDLTGSQKEGVEGILTAKRELLNQG